MNSPLVVIAGPTASGKTAFAVEVAKKYNGEIICADSRTVYKGMDVGTAKPTPEERKQVVHHLLDIVEPNQAFTAADFKVAALKAIDDIAKRGKLAVMVGGSGLYIDAVIFDYEFGKPADPKYRTTLQQMSVEALQQMCVENGYSLPINTKNKRHLVRAIEMGGLKKQKLQLRPNTLVVSITTEKTILKSRITERAYNMVQAGVLDETKKLSSAYGWDSEAMTGSIYRVLRPVVEGVKPLDEAIEESITSDMQLAKRQITWLKRNPYIVWGTAAQLHTAVEHFVHQNKIDESIPDIR